MWVAVSCVDDTIERIFSTEEAAKKYCDAEYSTAFLLGPYDVED